MKKGDTIQGRTLYKGGHYLRKYGKRKMILKIWLDYLQDSYTVYPNTVQSRFSDTLYSDKSRFSDNFAEDHFFST